MAFPTFRSTRIDPQPFRVLLCRRLQLPLPFSSRTCRCGRLLDCRGHHRAACAEAGVLGARGFALERAAAQVCREEGGRVSTNVTVRNLDIEDGNPTDARRLEIVVDGLTIFDGAQLAIDTTMVSPLQRDGTARRRAADHNDAALDDARRRKERTYPELVGERGRAHSSCWELRSVTGGQGKVPGDTVKSQSRVHQRTSGMKCAGRGCVDDAIY